MVRYIATSSPTGAKLGNGLPRDAWEALNSHISFRLNGQDEMTRFWSGGRQCGHLASRNFCIAAELVVGIQKCKCVLADASTASKIAHNTAHMRSWGLFLRLESTRTCMRASSSSRIPA